MPRIFDNIELPLLGALKDTLQVSERSDFCVGYFNLRGWRTVDRFVERWPGGEGNCCRLLVGMQRSPDEELRVALRLTEAGEQIDNQTALRIKRALAEHFRNQLMMGFPTNEDEAGLRRLAAQIKAKKLVVKLFMRHPLHAKLYLHILRNYMVLHAIERGWPISIGSQDSAMLDARLHEEDHDLPRQSPDYSRRRRPPSVPLSGGLLHWHTLVN